MKYHFSITFITALGLLLGCSAGNTDGPTGTGADHGGGGGGNDAGGGPSNGGNGAGGSMGSFSGGGDTGGEGTGGMIVNPCNSGCLDDEICDGAGKGLDDNCDGEVDENCPCAAGQASSCFRGDSSYLNSPGCNPGTMHCTELGTWGPCEGGSHTVDGCFEDQEGCHPINVVPFGTADLSDGTGNFDDDADAGTGSYTVMCPPGVSPCPAPSGTDYQPLQSGEYTVTYTKEVGGVEESCTYPLYVGAPGLRVELSWNFTSPSVDLDLHLKQPMSSSPWAITGSNEDCGWLNCTAYEFEPPFNSGPEWFPANNTIPDPVPWYLNPDFDQNTCYFAPRGVGDDWQDVGLGCHNPRLDLDNVNCNPAVVDVNNTSFCAPENINVDFPPTDQWMRIGVHHFSHSSSMPVRPNVKIFCNGALAAELGSSGYYDPPQVFEWNASTDVDQFWVVADVLFGGDACGTACVVQPVYTDDSDAHIPFEMTQDEAEASNGPLYPDIP